MWMLVAALAAAPAVAEDAAPSYTHGSITTGHNLKWVRDSLEYATLTQQTYRVGGDAVRRATRKARRKGPWVVVLDVDETVLDNSTYQLERAAYGVGFEPGSWYAWCERRAAPAIPGVKGLLDDVRAGGGQIVFITNRDEVTRTATRENLQSEGLWADGDVLCLADEENEAYTKVARRAEVRAGTGACSTGKPAEVVAYFGDTITDFPAADEEPVEWSAQFGHRYFILPNPLYGGWGRGVTRPLP